MECTGSSATFFRCVIGLKLTDTQSAVIPAVFITRAHLDISSARKDANSAGVLGVGSAPCMPSHLVISGAEITFTISLFRRLMIGCGVSAGANIANHVVASKAGRPASDAVGISGANEKRFLEVMA